MALSNIGKTFAIWFLDVYTYIINFFKYVNSINNKIRCTLLNNKVVYIGCMCHTDTCYAHVQMCDYESKNTLYILCAYIYNLISPFFISVDDLDFALHNIQYDTNDNVSFITVIYIQNGKKYYLIRRLQHQDENVRNDDTLSNIGYAILNYKNDITQHVMNFNESIKYTDMTIDEFAHILHFTFGYNVSPKNMMTVFDLDTFNEKIYKENDIIKI